MPEPGVAAAAGEARPQIDDLMLAMDVVDTLRHEEVLVSRELDQASRDAELIERLRRIYRAQGISVPERVLQEGVRALKERRFVYTPPEPSLVTSLALLWINRGRLGRRLLAIGALLILGLGVYYVGVVRPQQQSLEQARVEAERQRTDLTERIPRQLEQTHSDVLAEAKVPEARVRADQLLSDGKAALARSDRVEAEKTLAELRALHSELRLEYTLRIVAGGNEPSGVWRIPARNPNARNYYLLVEPVAPDGRVLRLPVTSEEDRRTETVSRWGVRVSEETFESVRRDKADDGIIQRDRVGAKRRGFLEIDYVIPVLGGTILRW